MWVAISLRILSWAPIPSCCTSPALWSPTKERRWCARHGWLTAKPQSWCLLYSQLGSIACGIHCSLTLNYSRHAESITISIIHPRFIPIEKIELEYRVKIICDDYRCTTALTVKFGKQTASSPWCAPTHWCKMSMSFRVSYCTVMRIANSLSITLLFENFVQMRSQRTYDSTVL